MPDTDKHGPLELDLSKDYREQCDRYLADASDDAEQAVSERDRDLAFIDDMLEMRGAVKMRGPWRDSCQLEDPLVREQHTQLNAKLAPPLQRDLLVQIDSVDPKDAESAKKTESWLEFQWNEEHFPHTYGEFVYNGLKDPVAVLSVSWQQEYKQERGVEYWDGVSTDDFGRPHRVPADGRDEGVHYEEVPTLQEAVESQKAIYEVHDVADVYIHPPNQQVLEKAQGIFIRRMYSECELLDGIEEYGYDKKSVMELIRMGPTMVDGATGVTNRNSVILLDTNDYIERMGIDTDDRVTPNMSKRDRQDRIEGIDSTVRNIEDGLYECREYWGYLPKLRDSEGNSLLPEHLYRDRVRALFCPSYNIVFLLDFAPDQELPFFHASMIPKPGRFLGTGMVQLMQAGGLAATYLTRWMLDCMQMKMTPAHVMPEQDYLDNGAFSLYPGAKFTESQVGAIRPLGVGGEPQLGLEGLEYILHRFQSLSSAEGIGELGNKVRRNPEMQNVLQTADAKYGLYGYNLFTPLAAIAARRIALELKYNPNFESTIMTKNGEVTVTADDLRKKFRFSAIQISSDSNPETRAGRTQQKLSIQATYFGGTKQYPEWALEIWHGARQALLDMDERNPASWIGEESRAKQIVQNVIAAAQQAQQGIDGGAGAGGQAGGGPQTAPNLLQPIGAQGVLPTP